MLIFIIIIWKWAPRVQNVLFFIIYYHEMFMEE